ncbi:MAG: amidohydrolase family protein, partial [Betaproteobacteria bacterium]|nr:amidohydrolase family protein [Betaproteobacteria bacterium]
VHGVGLDRSHFDEMAKAGAKLVWSPLSNFLLYGKTADVKAAKAAGVAISIAPDWAPSGSKSVLGELKVADLVNRHALNGLFRDVELVRMATRHPASALGWQQVAGQIAPGFVADLVIVDGRYGDVYRNLIEATDREVRATIVRGEALYGDTALVAALRGGTDGLEPFDGLLQRRKSIAAACRADEGSLREVAARLQAAMTFNGTYALSRMGAARVTEELGKCPNEAAPAIPPTAADATRMLACRFGLPFEETPLMPLTTAGDAEYWRRLRANPNVPEYLRQLEERYR